MIIGLRDACDGYFAPFLKRMAASRAAPEISVSLNWL